MKRFAFFLLAISMLAAGCNEKEQKSSLPEPTVTVEVSKADIKTIDLTLSVLSSGNELDSAELEFHGYKSEGDDSKLYQFTNLPTVVVNIANGEEVMFASKTGIPVTIKHPDEDDITDEQKKFIEDYFNKFEAAALGSYEAEVGTVRNHINTRLTELDRLIRR